MMKPISVRIVGSVICESMDVFILRLVLLLYLLIHCIALLPVNTTEQSFTSESSEYIKLLLLSITVESLTIGLAHVWLNAPSFVLAVFAIDTCIATQA